MCVCERERERRSGSGTYGASVQVKTSEKPHDRTSSSYSLGVFAGDAMSGIAHQTKDSLRDLHQLAEK